MDLPPRGGVTRLLAEVAAGDRDAAASANLVFNFDDTGPIGIGDPRRVQHGLRVLR